MNIFILEDDPIRLRSMKENFFDDRDHLQVIASCKEADAFQPPYDVVLLDHDLGGRHFTLHEDCGLTFVRTVLSRNPGIFDGLFVVVHSYNLPASMRMLDEIPNTARGKFYAAFGSADFKACLGEARRLYAVDQAAKARREQLAEEARSI